MGHHNIQLFLSLFESCNGKKAVVLGIIIEKAGGGLLPAHRQFI